MELLYVVAGVAAMCLAFYGIDQLSTGLFRTIAPWLVACVACLVIVIVFPPAREHLTWVNLQRPQFVASTLEGLGFLIPFGLEAALISRWLLRFKRRLYMFMPLFLGSTMLAWFVTVLAWWAIVPGS